MIRLDPAGIDLFADMSRNTGANDPLNRELMISLGCALENMMQAAAPNGLMPELTLFPDSANADHVARIELTAAPAVGSKLYDAIPHRRTHRSAYEQTVVSVDTLAAMTNLNDAPDLAVIWVTGTDEMNAFSALTIAATEAFIADTEQSVDSFAWWRGDWDTLQREKDGITLDAAGLSPTIRVLGKMMPDISRAKSDASWLAGTKNPQLSTAAAFGIIAVRDHQSSVQRLQAGRIYQRLHLWATDAGLAMQPLNQSVERRDRELQRALEPTIGQSLDALTPDWQAVMPFRIGYPKSSALKSPRRPVTDVVLG